MTVDQQHEFPPCMNATIRQIQNGGNPEHMARFALVSFLIDAGVSPKACKALFETVYDYDPQVTSFQVDQIVSRDYSAPTCEKMAECGLCPVVKDEAYDTLCEKPWLTHPNKYQRLKSGD